MWFFFQGGSIDSNVIFSPKSYIPRSFTSNITLTLFGEIINLFEVSIPAGEIWIKTLNNTFKIIRGVTRAKKLNSMII